MVPIRDYRYHGRMALIDLSGKVAIVTGAGHGAGRAIAQALTEAGARVAVNDINPDRAYRTAAELRDAGGAAVGIMADVSNRFQCVHLIETTRAEFGRLDILINHASISPTATVLRMDEWELMRVLDVNVKGVFFMTQLVGRVMADQRRADPAFTGLILNLVGPEPDRDGRAAYAATQAALPALTRACARELGPQGIRMEMVELSDDPGKTATSVMARVQTVSESAGQ